MNLYKSVSTFSLLPLLTLLLCHNPRSKVTGDSIDLAVNSPLTCDFENGTTCNWTPQKSPVSGSSLPNSSHFQLFSARQLDQLLGYTTSGSASGIYPPRTDHTHRTYMGSFVAVYSAPNSSVHRVRAALKGRNPTEYQLAPEMCLSFAYYFYSASGAESKLLVSAEREDLIGGRMELLDTIELYQTVDTGVPDWREVRYSVNMTKNAFNEFWFRVDMEDGFFGLDDIAIYPTRCKSLSAREVCHFEDALHGCDLFLAPPLNSTTRWRRFRGQEVYYLGRTLVDRTTGTERGHFIGPDLTGNISRLYTLESRKLPANFRVRCLTFSYYLQSSDSVKLKLWLRFWNAATGNWSKRAFDSWEVTGSTHGMWFTHEHNIQNAGYAQSVVIGVEIVELGRNVRIDRIDRILAFLDDIRFLDHPCDAAGPVGNYHCAFDELPESFCNLEPVFGKLLLTSVERQSLLNRTRHDTTMWTAYLTDYTDRTWRLFRPSMSSVYTPVDASAHTRDGGFLLLTSGRPLDRAILLTDRFPVIAGYETVCVQLAVLIPANESAMLELYQGESDEPDQARKLWQTSQETTGKTSGSSSNHNNYRWQKIAVRARPVSGNSTQLYFYLVGTVLTPGGFVAIDDLIIELDRKKGPCKGAVTTTTTTTTTTTRATISTQTTPGSNSPTDSLRTEATTSSAQKTTTTPTVITTTSEYPSEASTGKATGTISTQPPEEATTTSEYPVILTPQPPNNRKTGKKSADLKTILGTSIPVLVILVAVVVYLMVRVRRQRRLMKGSTTDHVALSMSEILHKKRNGEKTS